MIALQHMWQVVFKYPRIPDRGGDHLIHAGHMQPHCLCEGNRLTGRHDMNACQQLVNDLESGPGARAIVQFAYLSCHAGPQKARLFKRRRPHGTDTDGCVDV